MCIIGAGVRVQGGGEIDSNVEVLPISVVMKNENLYEGRFGGFPVQLIEATVGAGQLSRTMLCQVQPCPATPVLRASNNVPQFMFRELP